MTASATDTGSEATASRAPPPQGSSSGASQATAQVAAQRLNRLGTVAAAVPPAAAEATPPIPALRDFLTGDDQRPRDLMAFALAVEAGKPLSAEGVAGLRRKAEADLHAFAFRLLHNQVAEIRREAVEEHVARGPRPLSFAGAVLASLVGVLLAGGLLLGAVAASPHIMSLLAEPLAQLLSRF